MRVGFYIRLPCQPLINYDAINIPQCIAGLLHVFVSVDTCLHAFEGHVFSLSTSTLQIKEKKKKKGERTSLETLPLTKDSEKYMLSEMDFT